MQASKWVAVVTGAVAIALGCGYLILVQLLDWRGEMVPAPVEGMGLLLHAVGAIG